MRQKDNGQHGVTSSRKARERERGRTGYEVSTRGDKGHGVRTACIQGEYGGKLLKKKHQHKAE